MIWFVLAMIFAMVFAYAWGVAMGFAVARGEKWVKRRFSTVGVDYCTTHHGIRNEDMERCDFAEKDYDPEPCVLYPLRYDLRAEDEPNG